MKTALVISVLLAAAILAPQAKAAGNCSSSKSSGMVSVTCHVSNISQVNIILASTTTRNVFKWWFDCGADTGAYAEQKYVGRSYSISVSANANPGLYRSMKGHDCTIAVSAKLTRLGKIYLRVDAF